jgi:hypothetical protein
MNTAPVDNEEALHHRTVGACQTIRNHSGICERMLRSTMRRVEGCIISHGDILSTYYKCVLSVINHKLNVSGHMLMGTFFLALVYGTYAQNLSAPFSYTPSPTLSLSIYIYIYIYIYTQK